MRRTAIGFGVMTMLLAAVPAEAVVPLHYQRRNELRRIIDHPAFNGFGPIDRIELIAPDTWRVSSGRCWIDVRMVVPRRLSGPRMVPPPLEPQPGRQICRPLPR